MSGATVDGAADRLGRAEDLLDAAGERGREGLLGVAHGAGNVDDGVEFNVARVLDVLLLLAVADGLLEGADDERRSGRDDRDGGLTVLDRELDRDAETLPVAGRLGDVLTDLLGRLFSKTDGIVGQPSRREELWRGCGLLPVAPSPSPLPTAAD